MTSGPEPPWTTEKSLILFGELVRSLMAMVPNTKSGEAAQVQHGAHRPFLSHLKGGRCVAALSGWCSGQGQEQEHS